MPGGALVDGRPAHQGALARLRRRGQRLTVSRAEHDEADLERRLLAHRGVTRANTVAVMSPTGGVGKTTCTFLVANLLASHIKLRAIAVDANPEFGTLAELAAADRRPERDLADLLDDADRLHTAAELAPYVARQPTGLHVLASRHQADLGPDRYGELVALLSCFYDVVLLDLGPGMIGPLHTLAARRADQILLVATPHTWPVAQDARAHLPRTTRVIVAINKSTRAAPDTVAIPHDARLQAMLATHTYTLGALPAPTRTAIRRLGLAVAERLA
jgi:cellulose biosynthesis protein BcsQ